MFVKDPAIGGYELSRPISQLGNAETWVGRDARGTEVVIRFLPVRGVSKAGDVVSFTSRAASMAALAHPNIARLEDRGKSERGLFTVREYFPLGSLRTLADNLGPEQKLRAVLDVGRALEHAHRRGLAHGALKPENVLFGSPERPVLSDFSFGPQWANEFAAPEQRSGRLDALADQYGLAALATWALVGRLPVRGESLSVDPALDEALRRALSPFPDDRFRRLDELLAVFERSLRSSSLAPPEVPSVQVERSPGAIRVHVSGRWTPEAIGACVRQIADALEHSNLHAIGYQLDADGGCHSAAIEAIADLHQRHRSRLKRVGFLSDTPQARGASVLIGRRVDGLPWRTFSSADSMESWLGEGAG